MGVLQLAVMTHLPIAETFVFVILSTAKDLTNHSAHGVICPCCMALVNEMLHLRSAHSELEHSPSLSHLCGLSDSHLFVSPYHLQVAHSQPTGCIHP